METDLIETLSMQNAYSKGGSMPEPDKVTSRRAINESEV